MSNKIDVVLLAGFLGAGKTTVLNELIRHFHAVKLGLLVNDFGEVPVDGTLLKNENPELLEEGHKIYEIGNGSIFCSCLKAPFLYGLNYFQKERPDILFIEASGLSDPSSMNRILKDHGLEDAFHIRSVLTLVDPVRFEGLVHVLDVVGRQVETADAVLINKADLVTPGELEETEKRIRSLRPDVPVMTGSFGHFDYSFLENAALRSRESDLESCNTPANRPASLFLEGPVRSEEVFRSFLDKTESLVYRMKGFMELGGQISYVSDTGRGFSITEAAKPGIRTGLTVLCPKENEKAVADLWKTVRAGTFSVGKPGLGGMLR